MREVTDDVYIGYQHRIGNVFTKKAIKLTTRLVATKVAESFFDYVQKHGRQRVDCLHKAMHSTILRGSSFDAFMKSPKTTWGLR